MARHERGERVRRDRGRQVGGFHTATVMPPGPKAS
jgi:hypothetical protein